MLKRAKNKVKNKAIAKPQSKYKIKQYKVVHEESELIANLQKLLATINATFKYLIKNISSLFVNLKTKIAAIFTKQNKKNSKISSKTLTKTLVKSKKNNAAKLGKFKIALIVVFAITLIAALYFGYSYYSVKTETANQEKLIKNITDELSLPKDEVPDVFVVKDINKLPDDPFFKTLQAGDKIMAFKKSHLVVAYRPSTGTYVGKAKLQLEGDPTATPTPTQIITATKEQQKEASVSAQLTQAALRPATISVLNGTSYAGIAKKVADKLVALTTQKKITVDYLGNAVNKNYTKNLVVVNNAIYSLLATDIAKTIDGEVSSLPPGEQAFATDIVIYGFEPAPTTPPTSTPYPTATLRPTNTPSKTPTPTSTKSPTPSKSPTPQINQMSAPAQSTPTQAAQSGFILYTPTQTPTSSVTPRP